MTLKKYNQLQVKIMIRFHIAAAAWASEGYAADFARRFRKYLI